MANISFKQGSLSALNRQAQNPGTLWFTTDEGAIYLDTDSARVRFGDYITVDTINDLPSNGHAYESALYYAKKENVLARWDATRSNPATGTQGDWVQLNAGLSKIQIEGTGTVLSGASIKFDKNGQRYLAFSTATVLTDADLESLRTRVTSVEGRLSVLNGIKDDETVVGLIDAAKSELTTSISNVNTLAQQGVDAAAAAKTYAEENIESLKTKVTTNTNDIALLNKDKTHEGSVDYKIYQAVADILNNDDEAINSLQEIADWIKQDETGTAALNSRITAIETKNSSQDTKLTSLEGNITVITGTVNELNSHKNDYIDADTALENKLIGNAETYKTFGAIESAIGANNSSIDTINTKITNITNQLTWELFE